MGSLRIIPPLIIAAVVPGIGLSQAPPGPADSGLEEVVVTAQKERESLQHAAAAITALTADAVTDRGVTHLTQIQNLVPSVRMQVESASTEVYIRGVGSTLDLPMIEPPNAYNIDGVYVPREVSALSLFDVERIEVLPGPQGTLYGRGALGGVVNVVTQRPGPDATTSAELEAGNYSATRATVTQNLPLGPSLAARLSLHLQNHTGYERSGADSERTFGGRLALQFRPNESLDGLLWLHLEYQGGHPANLASRGSAADPRSNTYPHPGDPWNDLLDGALSRYASLGQPGAGDRSWRAALAGGEVSWTPATGTTLTYIPSYVHLDWLQNQWLTHKPAQIGEQIRQQTHELRLSGDGAGGWKWLAGLYAYRLESSGELYIHFGPNELGLGAPALWLDASDVRRHVLQGVAAFGQANYSVRDDLRLIMGVRASKDDRSANGYEPGVVSGPDPSTIANSAWANADSWHHADWKLGVEQDLRANSLLYATVQTGFQPGTFDTFPGAVNQPSKLLAVTLGSKNHAVDGHWRLNDELFYYDYRDLLTQAFDAATGGLRLTNARRARSYGNQLELGYAATPRTQLSLSVGLLHARYVDFVLPIGNYNGLQMQNAPDWTANVSLQHDWRFVAGGYLRGQAALRFESGFWGDFSHSPGLYQEPYTKTDVALTYHAPRDAWTLGLWGRNLENQVVQAAAAPGGIFDPGPGAAFLEPPRTFGLRATVRIAAE